MFDTRRRTKIEADNFIFFDVGLLYFIADLFLFCCLIYEPAIHHTLHERVQPDILYCQRLPLTASLLPPVSYTHLDKSAHNEIRDFYAHMALTHERRFARCFCRDSGNIT